MKSFLAALLLIGTVGCGAGSPDGGPAPASPARAPFDGYTLFHPLTSTSVYLVDMNGGLVHQWRTEYNTGQCVYLLDNGNLLRCARDPEPEGPYRGGGDGGIIQEIAPDSTLVWEYKYSDELKRHHHDVEISCAWLRIIRGLPSCWPKRTAALGRTVSPDISTDHGGADEMAREYCVALASGARRII